MFRHIDWQCSEAFLFDAVSFIRLSPQSVLVKEFTKSSSYLLTYFVVALLDHRVLC